MLRKNLIKNVEYHQVAVEYGESMAQPDLSYTVRDIIKRSMNGQSVNIAQRKGINDLEGIDEERQLALEAFEDVFEAMDYCREVDSFKKRLRQVRKNADEKAKREEEHAKHEKSNAETSSKPSESKPTKEANEKEG